MGAATGALVGLGAVSLALAVPISGGSCSQRNALKTVFPAATTVGFSQRATIKYQSPRAPVWPGRCVGWWTEYERLADRTQVDYVDVGVTLYRTAAQARVALREPAFGPVRVLSNGAKVRTAIDGGAVASVIRNVMISSTSSGRPVVAGGIPDFAGGPDAPAYVQMKIHYRIHAAVLRLR